MWGLQHQLLSADLENCVRDHHCHSSHALSFLQRLCGPAGSFRILALNSVLPHRDVHGPSKDQTVLGDLDRPQDAELGLPDRVNWCCHGFHPGAGEIGHVLQALPDPILDERNIAFGPSHFGRISVMLWLLLHAG